jgi:hypothetical protein
MTKTTTIMTITRTFNNPVFYDAAGVPEYEKEDVDIEVEISGTLCRAEPDVGLMLDWFEDIFATRLDNGDGIELTDKEEERAQEELFEAAAGDYADYLESMRD